MSEYLEFRNISTILTSVLLTVFGLLLGYLSSVGLDLPVTADVLASVCGGLILAVFSYYNAKNHNTFFDKDKDTIYIPINDLNENQIDEINSFIEDCVETNLIDKDDIGEIEEEGC